MQPEEVGELANARKKKYIITVADVSTTKTYAYKNPLTVCSFLMVTQFTIYRNIDDNPIGPKLSADVFAGFDKMRYL